MQQTTMRLVLLLLLISSMHSLPLPTSVFDEIQYTMLPLPLILSPIELASVHYTNGTTSSECGYKSRFSRYTVNRGLAGCCIGSYSKGGALRWDTHICFADIANYSKVPVMINRRREFRDAWDVIDRIAAVGGKMAIAGDSVMTQMVGALECSLNRNPERFARVEHAVERLNKKNWKYGLSSIDRWEIDGEQRLAFYAQYRPNMDMKQISDMMNEHSIVLLNFGLHYKIRQRNDYELEMSILFEKLIEFASKPKTVLIWRETSSQHVYSIGGEYPSEYHPDLGMTYEYWEEHRSECIQEKIFNNVVPHKWREEAIVQIAEDHGFRVVSLSDSEIDKQIIPQEDEPVLYILPFYDYSAARPDLHPTSPDNHCEPTHFCYYPQFWSPVWEELVRILDLAKYHNKL